MSEKITVSLIKADVGSIAGHSRPHPKMMEVASLAMSKGVKDGLLLDYYVTRCGDDMELLMTHRNGENHKGVHEIAWNAFMDAAQEAKKMHLYAAGQDLLSDAFSGNVRGQGPGAAEMEFVERPTEPMLIFMADKCGPAAYSLPIAKIFMDPFTTTGLVIDPRAHLGYDIEVVDVIDHKKVIMSSPAEMYDILALIGDTTRFAVKRVLHRDIGIAAVVSTEKLNISAGKYVGKDDPVMMVRCQSGLPAVGEALQPFAFPQLVSGWMRGSHYGAWYPCAVDESDPTYHDGPPRVCSLGLQISNGKIQGIEPPNSPPGNHKPLDYFAGKEWDPVRNKAMEISIYMRGHGPFMPGIVSPEELEYTTRPDVLKKIESRMEPL
ncbi:MAG: fructose-1,6-bisphosphatase [Candidatus Thermoplasmatota archaeon]|nr:fructose-1,6-bisphosphatase [Candidatus Thermoplasmatota archaeon]